MSPNSDPYTLTHSHTPTLPRTQTRIPTRFQARTLACPHACTQVHHILSPSSEHTLILACMCIRTYSRSTPAGTCTRYSDCTHPRCAHTHETAHARTRARVNPGLHATAPRHPGTHAPALAGTHPRSHARTFVHSVLSPNSGSIYACELSSLEKQYKI